MPALGCERHLEHLQCVVTFVTQFFRELVTIEIVHLLTFLGGSPSKFCYHCLYDIEMEMNLQDYLTIDIYYYETLELFHLFKLNISRRFS